MSTLANLIALNSSGYTGPTFASISRKVLLPRLQTLRLNGVRCCGSDLGLFLTAHTDLRTLYLENMDLTGPEGFTDVLRVLESNHDHLTSFRCYQIAHRSFRTFFQTLGDIETKSVSYFDETWGNLSMIEGHDVFAEFCRIEMPSKYSGSTEESEGVQQKIGLLRQDLRPSVKLYIPDVEGEYLWAH